MMGDSSSKEGGISEILFGKKFANFDEDDFEGTIKEYKIFKEVVYKNSVEDGNAKTSNVNQTSSSKDLLHESENMNLRTSSALVSFEENSSCCAQCGISCRDFVSMQETFSALKLNHQENEVQELNNSILNLGVLSKTSVPASYLPEKHKGNGAEPIVDNEDVSNVHEVKHKEVKVSNRMKSNASLISEENIATKETSNAIVCTNQCTEAPLSIGNSNTTVRINTPQRREVHSRLESCAHSLLVDAGWIIEVRQRTERIKPAYSFKNLEEGLNCTTLNLAWVSCGKILSASASESERNENGREWCGIDSFMNDMIATLDYIGEDVRQGSSLSLLKRWQLLDPFMAVAWIDKKVSVLRAGIGLKAVNSRTFMTDKVADTADNNNDESSTSLGKKRKKPYKSKSNCTSLQKESLFLEEHNNISGAEVTVNLVMADNHGENILRSEMSSPDQGCKHEVNIVASTDCNLICKSVCKESSSPQPESSNITLKMMCSNETKSKLKREASDDSAKKASKKSRKISDCNTTGAVYSASDMNDNNNPKESEDEGACDEALINNSVVTKKSKEKKVYRNRINDDDLLISLILKSKCRKARAKKFSANGESSQSKESKKSKNQTANRTLLLREKVEINSLGERTILSWLIENGALSVKDVLRFRNLENDEVVKDGRVTMKGILCKCCANFFSVSEFMAHANMKQQNSSLNLHLKSGKSYTECQLQAWSVEYKRRKNSIRIIGDDEKAEGDDTCGICGDAGDLICCDSCPSTYHKSCLSIKEVPEGNWYCSNCICTICNDPVLVTETTSSLGVLECSQCQLKYHGTCVETKVGWNGKLGSNAWLCGKRCRKVYSGLRSLVGVVNHIDDNHSWTVLRCNHGAQKIGSAQKVALMAECNAKLAIALTLMEESFLPMVDPKTGISMIPHVVYNFGSPFARLNYQGFYTVALEKGDVLISVATIRVHGSEVAEMPLVVSCHQYRRQGMCRRLLNAVEKILISLKVKMLLISAIPSLIDTWISSFGFKTVEAEDRQRLAKINLMPFPGTTLLKKKLLDSSAQEPDAVGSVDYGSSSQHSPDCSESMESVSVVAINQATENEVSRNNGENNIDFLQIEASFCAERDLRKNTELGSSIKSTDLKEMNHVLLNSQNISKPTEGVQIVRFEDKNAQNILIDDLHEKNAASLPTGMADKDEINDTCHATTCNMEEKASEKSIFLLRVVEGVYLS